MNKPLRSEPLDRHINQNGVPPGPRKLAQFKAALTLRDTPALNAQEGKEDDAIVYVKLFDPCGSWSWFLIEWDGEDQAFGLVYGRDDELGYFSLAELASVQGALGIGLEIDVHFLPQTLRDVKRRER
jgi:Protein of unknown function (DUF2958)